MRAQQAATKAALAVLALCSGALGRPSTGSVLLEARAECTAYKIQSGDSCLKIAQERCNPKISLSDLYKFNLGLEAKCNNLKVRHIFLASRSFGSVSNYMSLQIIS